ncbi:hypothetical protein [Mycoplasma suis]|uniref:Uncharacterized protein n=1 Tax=Mycoplasma suis (strain Illinois) TaxID=768700 RepID=F0QS77_MYCSL|nr:hypothetical protein [Mycoplasma suis]ADX98347.1 Conserved hypothetical protein [Mycoplasma suis str. Illinois]
MIYEKIISLELDFFEISQTYSEDELEKFVKMLRELSIYNNLFLFTNESYSFVTKFTENWNLPVGYIVFNSGSCVYSLAESKKQFENFLDRDSAILIARFCFFHNLSFIIHTSENISFTFGINLLNISSFRGLSFKYHFLVFQYKILKNWKSIYEVLHKYPIYSIEVLFEEKIDWFKECKMVAILQYLKSLECEFNTFETKSTIYFFSKENSKIETIQKVVSENTREEIENNLIYFSMNFPDFEFAIKTCFWFSDLKQADWITEKVADIDPIYMPRGNINWIEWWRENDYMWRHDLMKLGWIEKKIRNIDEEVIKSLNYEWKNNHFFELNLKSGLLSPKPLEGVERRWVIKRDDALEKSSIFLFLWPDQISNICRAQKQ